MMRLKKKKIRVIPAFLLTALAILYSVAITLIDVQPIGPQNTRVGFATLNGAVWKLTGYREFWYELTQMLGYLALGFVGLLGMVGLTQWIRRKNILKVDANILITGVYFLLILAAYFLFDKFPINFRPVVLDEGLEASYPSSHTVMALCVYAATAMRAGEYLKGKTAVWAVIGSCSLAVLMVVGRFLSGVHWFTDILGGLLISAALIALYDRAIRIFGSKPRRTDR